MRFNLYPLAVILCLIGFAAHSQPCTRTGTLTIGPAGNFPSLTAAAAALRTNGPSGNLVLELQSNYASTTETFPINFSGISCISAADHITIRPAANATGLSISTANQYTFNLANTRYLTIDGRPGGTGSAIGLTVSNTHVKGASVLFINSASNNTLKYLDITGTTTSTIATSGVTDADTTGVISFGVSSTGSGCDSNLITQCNIHDANGVTPGTLLYAAGAFTKINKHNSITNCNLYDFFQQSAPCYGIYIKDYNSDWTITGNSLYQTAARTFILVNYTPSMSGITINVANYSDFNVSGNYFGGSAPNAMGSALSLAGNFLIKPITVTNAYIPGHLSYVRSNVVNNLIARPTNNLAFAAMIGTSKFAGHCTDNIVGSSTASGNILYAPTGSQGTFIGFETSIVTMAERDSLARNILSGVTLAGNNPSFWGINTGGSQNHLVVDNHIGYPSLTGSITNTSGGDVYGIRVVNYQSSGNLTISGNNISNMVSSGTSFSAQLTGIFTEGSASGRYMITNNEISDLSMAGSLNNTATPVLSGMFLDIQGVPAMNVSGNKIHGLSKTSATSAGYIDGIFYGGPAAGADSIYSNVISGFTSTSSGAVTMRGIELYSGNSVAYNNVVRLGLNDAGNSVTGNYLMVGINESAGVNSITHNSVYIGGNSPAGVSATHAVKSELTSGTRVIANNILYNGRSSVGASNYCVTIGGSATTGLTLDYNLYYTDGTGGNIGRFNSIDYPTLTTWTAALGRDANSTFANPAFAGITGPLSSMNYHLSTVNPAEGKGTASNTVLTDIDGETRSLLTPTDIGADAGLYTLTGTVATDNTAPVITYTALSSAADFSTRTLTATIVDRGAGVDTAGVAKPRLWFRKKNAFSPTWVSSPGIFQSGATDSAIYNFTIDYALIPGGVSISDSIQYYVVAQDKTVPVNVGSSPTANHSSVTVQIAAPAVPTWYVFYVQLPDTILVGPGQQYTSLTKPDGVFNAINSFGIANNTVLKITGDLTETGVIVLKEIGLHNHSISIIPASAGVKTITNNNQLQVPVVALNGTVSAVTIDGRFNGSGRNLRFASVTYSSSSPALSLGNNTSNVTITNCIFEVASSYDGVALVLTGNNHGILIDSNVFRKLDDHPLGGGTTANYIASRGEFRGKIRNNYLSDCYNESIIFSTPVNGTVSDTCTITGNHFFQTTSLKSRAHLNISNSIGLFDISDNYFGGSAPFCAGNAMECGDNFRAIDFASYRTTNIKANVSIQGNTITNLHLPSASANSAFVNFYGIAHDGPDTLYIGNMRKNIIGSMTNANAIKIDSITGSLYIAGGIKFSNAAITVIENNDIGGINATAIGGAEVAIIGILQDAYVYSAAGTTSNITIRNNHLKNLSLAGNALSSAFNEGIYVGMVENSGTMRIDHNVVEQLNINSPGNGQIASGISIAIAPNYDIRIENNRIADIRNAGVRARLSGIDISQSSSVVQVLNNQVSLTNLGYSNPINLAGIRDDLSYDNSASYPAPKHTIQYNSIYLGGTASVADSSAGLYLAVNATNNAPLGEVSSFKNNLVYNEHHSAGGKNAGIIMEPGVAANNSWTPSTSDNNLFVVADTSAVANFTGTDFTSVRGFKLLTQGDENSYAAFTSSVPAAQLFTNSIAGDLNINTNNDVSWYVNGKGVAVNNVNADFNDNPRSITVADGATDIGSNEFTTNTLPPALQVFGRHMPGGSDTLVWSGQQVGIINWDNSGMLPDLGLVRWYTGTWPNDTTNNGTVQGARFMNTYLQVPAIGGSNFRYNITLNYRQSMLGHIANPATMIINKREINTRGSWRKIIPTENDETEQILTANGLTSFSEFTATDLAAPLSNDLVTNEPTTNSPAISLSENPVRSGTLTIRLTTTTSQKIDASIFDNSGKLITTFTGTASGNFTHAFDLSRLPAGAYLLKVLNGDIKTTKKFVVIK